jgi:hypothetical protein
VRGFRSFAPNLVPASEESNPAGTK